MNIASLAHRLVVPLRGIHLARRPLRLVQPLACTTDEILFSQRRPAAKKVTGGRRIEMELPLPTGASRRRASRAAADRQLGTTWLGCTLSARSTWCANTPSRIRLVVAGGQPAAVSLPTPSNPVLGANSPMDITPPSSPNADEASAGQCSIAPAWAYIRLC
ncbi:hypothetical protein LZ31DRAFT_102303 [Colletotrichum somersetense]|nr:hypothetical protein LZ31DRAFT_102303 [Colletotrichum somersetense]